MVKIIEKEKAIKIGKEPMVILPLKKWEAMKGLLEDWEDAVRFNQAFEESRGEKMISLGELKKKYNLK